METTIKFHGYHTIAWYLHEICEPPIIHRDFKSANVLLDEELSVQVSDCDLAPLITSGSVSQLSGHLLTANGYGASEFESGIHTSKSDVFSFGVVMLELLTGRKSYDRSRNRGEHFLVRWAIPQLYDIDALSRMVDPSLNGAVPNKALSCFADIISRCVETEPEFRPAMSEVIQDLLKIVRGNLHSSRMNDFGSTLYSIELEQTKVQRFSLPHSIELEQSNIVKKLQNRLHSKAPRSMCNKTSRYI